ncbi:MAG: hypothetical protein FWD24_07150 [Treponema sp.]|nr:hypothetical protein [Treponema sp.]
MKTRFLIILLLAVFCAGLAAQSTASEIAALAASETVTWAQAARYILQASNVLVTANPNDAFWHAAIRKWLPYNAEPDETARIDGVSLLIMEAFNLRGGAMYSISGNQHYAYHELINMGVITGTVDRFRMITGEQLVLFTGNLLAIKDEEQRIAALFAEERLAREKKDVLQPDTFNFRIFTDQLTAVHSYSNNNIYEYRAKITPSITFLLSDKGNFNISLGLTAGFDDFFYDDNESLYSILELLQTDLYLRFGDIGFRVGRFHYSDPMKFVADSLFDGVQLFYYPSDGGLFSFGAWFTGILYKKTANIMMTESERMYYYTPIDRDNFLGTYFATNRFLLSFDWEHPSVIDFLHLNATVNWQIDGTSSDLRERLNSQYFSLRAAMEYEDFYFVAGGSIGTFFSIVGDDLTNFKFVDFDRFSLAAELGIYYIISSQNDSVVSFTLTFGTGNVLLFRFTEKGSGLPFYPYVPLTTSFYGKIYQPTISGLTLFKVDYKTNLNHLWGMNFTAAYYIRNDETIYPGNIYGDDLGAGENFLGAEVYTQIIFNPFSDLQYNLGIGAFIPKLGNNWPDAKTKVRVSLTTLFYLH